MIYSKIHTQAGEERISEFILTCLKNKQDRFQHKGHGGGDASSSTATLLTKQTERKKASHLSSGVQVADGVGFKITFILPAQHGGDDDDDHGDHCDGGQHCGDDPKVVRRVLDHGWDREGTTVQPRSDKTFKMADKRCWCLGDACHQLSARLHQSWFQR